MRGVFIEDRIATVARSPYRADVALFVGFVDRRRARHDGGDPSDDTLTQAVVPGPTGGGDPSLYQWLIATGWARGDASVDRRAGLDELVNIPVPIDALAGFDRLFAGEARSWGEPAARCDTYLRAAVAAYFAEGGRLCYVVRVGAPWPVPMTPRDTAAAVAARSARLAALIPGYPGAATASPVERATWTGVWTLYGLPDVSFVCLPDLPDIVRAPLPEVAPPPPVDLPAVFSACGGGAIALPDLRSAALRGPVVDDAGAAAWAVAVRALIDKIGEERPAGSLREVHAVLALPRPADDRGPAALLAALGVASRFLQLTYPWLRTTTGATLPEGVIPADGTLAGVLARNALERGTYRSAAGRDLLDALAVDAPLAARDLSDPSDATTLGGRVSLVGSGAAGMQVLSDVTTALGQFRVAHVSRLVAAIDRALRAIGEALVFEPNGAEAWAAVRDRVTALMRTFWQAGALRGAAEADAFTVRCDRTTMTQDDLDSGRLIAVLEFAAVASIQRINVVLTRTSDGVAVERAA
jgi:hypothetical protein